MRRVALGLLLLFTTTGAVKQAVLPAGTLVESKVASVALKSNLLGDPAESRVAVYLPQASQLPSAAISHHVSAPRISDRHRDLTRGFQSKALSVTMDNLIARGVTREMIVVVPSGRNGYFGGFYTNSPVGGGWEDYIARELVSWIDAKYRTIPNARSRGIVGHSMGGYGALMLAMKYPDVFGAVYAMSPCCLSLTPMSGATILRGTGR